MLLGLGYCDSKPLYSQRVLGTDVNDALVGADCISADGHPFEDCVGIAFDGASVHECARVAFVRVADYIFLVAFLFRCKFPFGTCWKTRPAAAS